MQVQTLAGVAWAVLAAGLCGVAQAQAPSPGIYSCVDAAGRKITADRPIAECTDRSQRQINPSGTVKRIVGPSLTAQERDVQEQKDKAAAEVRAREAEEKRRDRALLLRYPSRAVHDKERAEALDQIDAVIKAASKRTTELAGQRKAIDADLEFYKSDPARAPASLKRRLEENDSSVAVQKRFIADQDAEKKRVNMRFDEELAKLNQLWAMGGAVPAAAAGPAVRK
jgi:hypothetical protein